MYRLNSLLTLRFVTKRHPSPAPHTPNHQMTSGTVIIRFLVKSWTESDDREGSALLPPWNKNTGLIMMAHRTSRFVREHETITLFAMIFHLMMSPCSLFIRPFWSWLQFTPIVITTDHLTAQTIMFIAAITERDSTKTPKVASFQSTPVDAHLLENVLHHNMHVSRNERGKISHQKCNSLKCQIGKFYFEISQMSELNVTFRKNRLIIKGFQLYKLARASREKMVKMTDSFWTGKSELSNICIHERIDLMLCFLKATALRRVWYRIH